MIQRSSGGGRGRGNAVGRDLEASRASKMIARVAQMYQKSVGKSLRMYGIKYDDLLVDTKAVQEALHHISNDEYTSRQRRIARAADCSLKRTYLPDEIQAIQAPFDGYLAEKADVAEELAAERRELTRWSSFAVARHATFDFSDGVDIDDDDDDDELMRQLVQEDNDQSEFGADAVDAATKQRMLLAQTSSKFMQAMLTPSARRNSRPTSAPPSRAKPWGHGDGDERAKKKAAAPQRGQTSVSVEYLRQAAEKKKARDRDFARELQREESEYKKKITLKIDQANKMSVSIGSKRTYMLAPDREGMHMIKVVDSAGSDRVISVELGQSMSRNSSVKRIPQENGAATADGAGATASLEQRKSRMRGLRASHVANEASMADLHEMSAALMKNNHATGKPGDRTLVQEELKSVLASTIELTKVLQEQLHELKLKGWNFAAAKHNATAPAN
ncbi:TPA: hypothetical protein N0F65_008754 [Lagenidium giganteum]|uniref:Uncharacterized protein n=1 Tax=Lagenidium giganteum TaxID=4803 RepID=A0AAV2YZ22_9STRA|nr:TPA: hypothetical protein N0F65_008754 [Lagenidium giganteum]